MANLAVETDKGIVLKCERTETVRHSLVSLEGEIKPFTNGVSFENPKNDRSTEKDAVLDVQNLSNSKLKAKEIFIDHKGHCQSWPVIDGRFKAFVKLDKGENLVRIQCHELNLKRELRIFYEKQQNQHRYVLWWTLKKKQNLLVIWYKEVFLCKANQGMQIKL